MSAEPAEKIQNMQLIEDVRRLLKDDNWQFSEQVQALWSGYGSVARIINPDCQTSYVVKQVAPPQGERHHPRGWNTHTGHQRKLLSYQVEQHFYQHYSKQCQTGCLVPQLIAHGETNGQRLLILEDLDASGFNLRIQQADWATLSLGIKWLAQFHVQFLHAAPDGLWSIGSYWHLATRQDEWEKMPESPLKSSAAAIDNKLSSAQFKTLVHGDAKLANMCFRPDLQQVACVDFQYVGGGAGVKDLAYFVGSCLSQTQLFEFEEAILNSYFQHMRTAIKENSLGIDADALEQEYRQLYPLAWADFERFLIGWNPNSWKLNDYMTEMTQRALSALD